MTQTVEQIDTASLNEEKTKLLSRIQEIDFALRKAVASSLSQTFRNQIPIAVVLPVVHEQNNNIVKKAHNYPPLYKHVIDILSEYPEGLIGKEIEDEVRGLIEEDKYYSKTNRLDTVVYQALHTLRKRKIVVCKKNEFRNINVYKLAKVFRD